MTLSKSCCNNPINPTIIKRRILILSLEFNYSTFSGNGVLSRSIGSRLARRDDCTVRVICAKPHPATPDISNDIDMSIIIDNDQFDIWPVELSRQCKWKRLDREGPWNEYATNACNFVNNVKDYQPTDVIAVDWHGMLAWRSIISTITTINSDSAASSSSWHPTIVKVCYYNFRVYSNSDYADDKSFYKEKEQLSCQQMSNVVICLSEHDRSLLQKLIDDYDTESLSNQKIHILYPPLRGDIYNLAMNQSNIGCSLPHEVKAVVEKVSSSGSSSNRRIFITCMARLSPEKTPHNFVTLLRKLGGVDFLRTHSLIPILCGSKSVDEYANKVINDFKALCSADGEAWPCIVITRHLGPENLAAVFSSTVINVHVSCWCVSPFFIEMIIYVSNSCYNIVPQPCLYDAYGMTIIESGAFEVPSIVNRGGKVGAASLLGEGSIAIDLETILDLSDEDAKRCDDIRTVLDLLDNKHDIETKSDGISLKRIAKEAKSRALGWDEAACCQGLIDILNGLHT